MGGGVLNTVILPPNRTNTASPQEILSTQPHHDFALVSGFTWSKWFLKKKLKTITPTFQT